MSLWELLSNLDNVTTENFNVSLTEEEISNIESSSNHSHLRRFYSQLNDSEFYEKQREWLLDDKKKSVIESRKAELWNSITEEIRRPWDNNYLKQWVQYESKKYMKLSLKIDNDNQNAFEAMCYYFTNDKMFEELDRGYSLRKGLLIIGNVGTGKTTLMKLFAKNQKSSYEIESCRRLSDKYAIEGVGLLEENGNIKYCQPSFTTFLQNNLGICYDDLGTERNGIRYGDSVNIMEHILLNRYENSKIPFFRTHITTNLTADEIEQMYGTRVRSRMREMFNTIVLDGKDRRM